MKIARMLVGIALFVGLGSFTSSEELSDKDRAKRDQLRIAVQEICPVSGAKLAGHGQPASDSPATLARE